MERVTGLSMWKICEENPNYEISNTGLVRNTSTKEVLKPKKHSAGYLCINLYKSGEKPKTRLIHRLVAAAFLPNPEDLPQINHLDGDKHNNYLENLEWCSRSSNVNHAYFSGATGVMGFHGRSSITLATIVQIRMKYATGAYTQQQLADEYGIGRSTVSAITLKKTWKIDNGQQGPTKAYRNP